MVLTAGPHKLQNTLISPSQPRDDSAVPHIYLALVLEVGAAPVLEASRGVLGGVSGQWVSSLHTFNQIPLEEGLKF